MAEATKLVRAIFDEASEIEIEAERQAYLEQACGGDAALRARIEKLLRAEARAGRFLADPKREQASGLGIVEKEGDRIGRYKLLQRIGEGGCGIVYMAEQTEPVRRRVALKIIKLGMDTRSVVARFQAERQALALMDHPSIARIHDAGATDTGRPYFVMELVRGVRITDFCEQNQLSTDERLKLFIQVCQAVQHAHQKGIIHRDLKPSNVLVTSDDGVPLPKIIDFGIAKATADVQLTNLTLFTRFDMFIGTPAYMSPEQAEFNAQDVDTRTDIYSLGVLLYELLTGHPPFDTATWLKSGIDTLRKGIREIEPTRPSTRLTMELAATDAGRPARKEREGSALALRQQQIEKLIVQLRGDLDSIVLKALEKDRTRRYATANGLAADIQRYLANEPVQARPPSRLYLLRKLVGRHRAAFAVGTAAVLLLVSGILFTLRDAWRSRAAERVQRNLRERAEQAKSDADVANQRLTRSLFLREWQDHEHLLEQGKVSSALTWFARTVRARPDDVAVRTRLVSILTEHNFALPARSPLVHGAPLNNAFLTSDGTYLVSAASDNQVRIWDLVADAQPRMLPEAFAGPSVSIVSPGNQLLVQDSAAVSLWEWGGTPVKTVSWERPAYEPVLIPPDGRFVFLNSKDGLKWWDTNQLQTIGRFMPTLASVLVVNRNRHYLFGLGPESLSVWDAASGKRIWDGTLSLLPGASDWMGSAMDLQSRYVVANRWAGSAGASELSLWNLGPEGVPTTSSPSQIFWARGRVSTMVFSPSGDRLYVGDNEGSVGCVDLLASEPHLSPLNCEHDGMIKSMSCARDGQLLATASVDGTVRLWNVRMESPEPRIFTNGTRVWDAKFSPDSSWFVMGGVESAEIRDTATGALRHRLPFKGLVNDLEVSRDGRRIVTCSGKARVWDAQTGAPIIDTFDTEPSDYTTISADGRWFCLVTRANTANLYETETGRPGPVLTNSSWGIRAMFSRDARRLIVATMAGDVEFWSLPDGRRLDRSVRHKDIIWNAVLSPDERLLLTASRDRTAALWDAETGQLIREFRHEQQVLTAAFSPDARRILTGDGSRRAFVWDVATGQRVFELIPHPGSVWYGEFSADGRLILTGDDAGNSRIWDAASGLPLCGWVKNGPSLKRTHLSPDAKWALSAAETGSVRVWPVHYAAEPAPSWLPELAEALAGRRLRDDGTLEQVPVERCLALTKSLAANKDNDFYGRWARWFLVERMKEKPEAFVP